MFTGASADGRKSAARLSNGVCPTNGMEKNGPTAVLNSVKKFDHSLATNGVALTMAIHPNTLNSDVFRSLIQTYFQPDGGFQVQFNAFSKDTLIDAQANPDKYGGLVIRIAGYSVDFIALSKKVQNEVISRTLH
jgi:formate C-acetyltransferase